MSEEARDVNFVAVIFLQGTAENNMDFVTKAIPENESIALISAESRMVNVHPSSYKIVTLNFELHKDLRNCDENLKRMTPCIKKFYDDNFGNDFSGRFIKFYNLSETTFAGLDEFEKLACMIHVLL